MLRTHHFNRQRGAMFGLDARLALIILSVLSVIAGAMFYASVYKFQGGRLTQEITNFNKAVTGLQNDLQDGIHNSLTVDNDTNAFAALYDNSVLKTAVRGKWLGPYISLRSNTHPEFGTMKLIRAAGDNYATTSCGLECYYWIYFDSVPTTATTTLNDNIDGANETDPDTSGAVRWVNAGQTNHVYVRLTTSM